MSENKEIPNGWANVRLDDVCSFEYGRALKANLRNEKGPYPVLGSNGFVGFHDTYLVKGPGVVIGRKGAAGEISFVAKNFWPIDTTYFLKVNDDSSLLYFYFLLKSLRLNQFEKSTAIPGLNRNDAYDQLIPLPPLPEQHRIVAKIEELFSSLDKGIESLKTAQQQLKVYRQAVLKWAFEGKLTNNNVVDGALPEGWKLVKLGDVCFNVEYGSAAKSKEIGKVPVLRMGNIQDGKFDWGDLVYTDNEIEINKYLLNKSDVLFNRTNSPEWVGKTAMYKGERPAIFAGYLIRINRIENLIDASYLTYYLNSYIAKNYGNSVRTFGVNQANINGTKLKTYPLPLPLLSEQHAIVAEIESRLSVCDKIEETIEQSLQQSESLRQSILKKAFEGKLVPQDPNDEPAAKLLERIRVEKEALKKKK